MVFCSSVRDILSSQDPDACVVDAKVLGSIVGLRVFAVQASSVSHV